MANQPIDLDPILARPNLLGLAGVPGSGKTTLANIFEGLGIIIGYVIC